MKDCPSWRTAAHLGLPVPEKLKEVLEQLHDRESNDTKEGK
jgi:phage-related holin